MSTPWERQVVRTHSPAPFSGDFHLPSGSASVMLSAQSLEQEVPMNDDPRSLAAHLWRETYGAAADADWSERIYSSSWITQLARDVRTDERDIANLAARAVRYADAEKLIDELPSFPYEEPREPRKPGDDLTWSFLRQYGVPLTEANKRLVEVAYQLAKTVNDAEKRGTRSPK